MERYFISVTVCVCESIYFHIYVYRENTLELIFLSRYVMTITHSQWLQYKFQEKKLKLLLEYVSDRQIIHTHAHQNTFCIVKEKKRGVKSLLLHCSNSIHLSRFWKKIKHFAHISV